MSISKRKLVSILLLVALLNIMLGTAAAQQETTLTATTTGVLNVRSGPSTDFEEIGQLGEDTSIVLIKRWISGDEVWALIEFEGQDAWVATWWLEIDGDLNELPLDFIYLSSVMGEDWQELFDALTGGPYVGPFPYVAD